MKTLLLFIFAFMPIHLFGYGIDLSSHNSVEDWSKVKASFIYVKATEGTTFQDKKFKSHFTEAKKRNIPVGAYHFMTTSSSAKSQFYNFYNTTRSYKMDLIPVLDIERQTKGYSISKKKLQREVRIFVNLCKKYYGKAQIIYCSQHFYIRNFKGKFNDCQYWCGDVYFPALIPCSIHQQSIKKVPGFKGRVDYNVLKVPLKNILL